MVINATYYKACDMAYNLCPPAATDIVHDAFVAWYDKTKRNLFDEREKIVMNMVKRTYWSKYFDNSSVSFNDRLKQNLTTPEDEYIEQESGLRFMTFSEIDQYVKNYEQYHTTYPKISLN